MNVAQEIYELINHKWDYTRANTLYQEIGENTLLKFLFNTGENSMNSDKLLAELERLGPQYPFTLQRREERQEVQETLPTDVLQIEMQWKSLYKESNHLRTELFRLGEDGKFKYTEEERCSMALTIRENFNEIERLWGAVDYFREHGHIPPVFHKVEVDLESKDEIKKRIRNLGSYIAKARKGKAYTMTIGQMLAEKATLERKYKN